MSSARGLGLTTVSLAFLELLPLSTAQAFPPYRSTDADTADPYTLELRVGLVKLEYEDDETEVLAPLLRANFGLPNKFELISEFEYLPEDGEFGDGAAGFKWVPLFGSTWSFGIETLTLLPVRLGDDGLGVESQLLATFWRDRFRVHLNAGGSHDGRITPAEDAWRASVLAEFPREGYRPSVELFAKHVENKSTDVRAGVGIIYDVGSFDIRTALHVWAGCCLGHAQAVEHLTWLQPTVDVDGLLGHICEHCIGSTESHNRCLAEEYAFLDVHIAPTHPCNHCDQWSKPQRQIHRQGLDCPGQRGFRVRDRVIRKGYFLVCVVSIFTLRILGIAHDAWKYLANDQPD